MNISLKKILVSVAAFIAGTSAAYSLEISQADKIASRFDNTNGKVIELRMRFNDPLRAGDELDVQVGGTPALRVRPTDKLALQMLLARFRFKVGEQMVARHLRSGTVIAEANITPRVVVDFEYPPASSAPVKVLVAAKGPTLAGYGLREGGCIVLFNNYPNPEGSSDARLLISATQGSLDMHLGTRTSANPTFGLMPMDGNELTQCEGRVN
jgi:hypothetical protein